MDVILERILESKAKELGITKGQALEIYKATFYFLKKVMAEGDFQDLETYKSIYIKDLGTFYPNKRMILKIQENINKQTNEDI